MGKRHERENGMSIVRLKVRAVAAKALAFASSAVMAGVILAAMPAHAMSPKPAPLAEKQTLKVAFLKTGFVSPLLHVPELLKELNIEYSGIEFQRYADTRSAITTKEADIGLTGGTLLIQALASGNEDLIALMGVAGEDIYPVVRDGVKVEKWEDLIGLKIGAGVGGNVWTQWVAKIIEVGLPYNKLNVTGIQGGGQNYNIALRRGDIDVAILWSPFNTMPVVDGYAYWPKALEFGMSQPVGGEQGIWMVQKDLLVQKKELIERFLWAYKAAEEKVKASNATKAAAIQNFTGVKPEVAKALAEVTHFGADATPTKLKAMAKLMADQGIVKKDVSDMIDAHFDTTLADKLK